MKIAEQFDYVPISLTKLYFGPGRIKEIFEILDSLNMNQTLLVTSPSIRRSGLADSVEKNLKGKLASTFEQVQPHSPLEIIRKAFELSIDHKVDSVVSLGGGACVDTASGIVYFQLEELNKKLVHIAVPTTLSGAEFTNAAGITHGLEKRIYRGPHMVATVVLLDPEAAMITPPSLFLPSGLNAIHHCVEGICSIRSNGISDALFLRAIRLLQNALPRIRENPNDVEARGEAQVGSSLGSMAIWGVPMGIGHAMAHAIGGIYKAPHAITHSVVMIPTMEYNHDEVIQSQIEIAEAMGLYSDVKSSEFARKGIQRMRTLLKDLGIPESLSELNISPNDDELKDLAQAVMKDPCFFTNPKPASLEDVIHVIRKAIWPQ